MHKGLVKIEHHSFTGTLWVVGWLFTAGFLKLSFGWGLIAIIVWPYLLGAHFAP